jgi:hypothetical protein
MIEILKHRKALRKKMGLRYYKDPESGCSNFPMTPHSEVSLGYDYSITIESLGNKHKCRLTSKSGMISVSEIIAVLCKNTDLKILYTAEEKAKAKRSFERRMKKMKRNFSV